MNALSWGFIPARPLGHCRVCWHTDKHQHDACTLCIAIQQHPVYWMQLGYTQRNHKQLHSYSFRALLSDMRIYREMRSEEDFYFKQTQKESLEQKPSQNLCHPAAIQTAVLTEWGCGTSGRSVELHKAAPRLNKHATITLATDYILLFCQQKQFTRLLPSNLKPVTSPSLSRYLH